MKNLLALLLSVPCSLFSAFVFSHMWNWFLVRLFPTMPHLTTVDAVGLLMVIAWGPSTVIASFRLSDRIEKDPKNAGSESLLTALGMLFFVYPATFVIAYLWHLAVG